MLNLIGLQGVVFCTFLVVGVDFLSIGFEPVILEKVVAVLGRGVVSAWATFGRSFFISPGTVIGSGFDVDEGDFEMCLGGLGGSKALGVVIDDAELACWIVETPGSFVVSESSIFDVEGPFADGKDWVDGSIVDSSVTVVGKARVVVSTVILIVEVGKGVVVGNGIVVGKGVVVGIGVVVGKGVVV